MNTAISIKNLLIAVVMVAGILRAEESDDGFRETVIALEKAMQPLMEKLDEREKLFEAMEVEAASIFKDTEAGKDAANAVELLALKGLMRIQGIRVIEQSISILGISAKTGRPLTREEREMLNRNYDQLIDIEVETKPTRLLEKAIRFDPDCVEGEFKESLEIGLSHTKATVHAWDGLYEPFMDKMSHYVDE